MNLEDLRKLIHIAHSENVQATAIDLSITAGALSKTIKKIESQLNCRLFDRIGRNIRLNNQGEKFINYATKLVHEYDQMCSEFTQNKVKQRLKIAGPSVLLNHAMNNILAFLPHHNTEVSIEAAYEGQALKLVVNGQADVAIVTKEALSNPLHQEIKSVDIGQTTFTLIAAKTHQVFMDASSGETTMDKILSYPFVCPSNSPFCGIERGIGSDGWPDQQYQRKILCRTDDFSSLLSLVKQGDVLAYVPDFVIKNNDLRAINSPEYDYHYQESFCLIYKPSLAHGWLNQLILNIKKAVN